MKTVGGGGGGSPLPRPLFQGREMNSPGLKIPCSLRWVDPGFLTQDDDLRPFIEHLLSSRHSVKPSGGRHIWAVAPLQVPESDRLGFKSWLPISWLCDFRKVSLSL